MPYGTGQPSDEDWHGGTWVTTTSTNGTYLAQILLGPAPGGLNLGPGTYTILVRVADDPEVPVIEADILRITSMPLTYAPGILGPVVDPLTATSDSGAQTLIPTRFVPDGSGLDITAVLAAPIRTTLQFANTGQEILLVRPAADTETVTVDILVTILGQHVSNFPAVTMLNGHLYVFGPFSSLLDQPGTGTGQVTLSTVTSIQVALLQKADVYY